jgi:predicted metal-dependent phosphoesterase TrpH
MIIDLHIHSKNCSDGRMDLKDIFNEAKKRNIELISIADHDSMDCQHEAKTLAEKHGINYITGMELNISFTHPELTKGKTIALDFLAYQYDPENISLKQKLKTISEYREERALKILEKINIEFESEGLDKFTLEDIKAIQDNVDGVFGRPHIADYLISKGIVANRQEAFDRYLVKCNVPKYPFTIEEASQLVREASGILVFAHPNDPGGTSLVKVTTSLDEQTEIIEKAMLPFIDGIECWHFHNSPETTKHYMEFAKKHQLVMTGGSDCHQSPIRMGTVDVPDFVAQQFNESRRGK